MLQLEEEVDDTNSRKDEERCRETLKPKRRRQEEMGKTKKEKRKTRNKRRRSVEIEDCLFPGCSYMTLMGMRSKADQRGSFEMRDSSILW